MSRLMMSFAVLGLLIGSVNAADSECLKEGDAIGAFYVTKVAGAEQDGVEKGTELCYRCRYGSRPMVMVFARKSGGKVTDLVKELDAAIADNEGEELKGLLTLMGEDASALKETAVKVAKKSGAKNIPVVVAQDNVSGPSNYKLDEKAAVTVIVANSGKVVASHAFETPKKVDVAAVIGDIKKMFN